MKKVVIIGGGVAGMEAASQLNRLGHDVEIIEKDENPGGKLLKWDRLFPDKRPASEVLKHLQNGLSERIKINTSSNVSSIVKKDDIFSIQINNERQIDTEAILISTGFELFKAQKKEEYGYGIYDNVITSADLEELFRKGGKLTTASGEIPKRIGIIHCVGSRDEKAGNEYCSKVCCITGVKQAIELKESFPDAEVFCFYMDLRMFGKHFEELYREAQEKWGIRFVRGRLSETCENHDGSLLIKVEDTLAGKPMKMSVDVLVLLAGMVSSKGTMETANLLNVNIGGDGFILSADEHLFANNTNAKGVFVTGTATGPKSISETLADARSAALRISEFLKGESF